MRNSFSAELVHTKEHSSCPLLEGHRVQHIIRHTTSTGPDSTTTIMMSSVGGPPDEKAAPQKPDSGVPARAPRGADPCTHGPVGDVVDQQQHYRGLVGELGTSGQSHWGRLVFSTGICSAALFISVTFAMKDVYLLEFGADPEKLSVLWTALNFAAPFLSIFIGSLMTKTGESERMGLFGWWLVVGIAIGAAGSFALWIWRPASQGYRFRNSTVLMTLSCTTIQCLRPPTLWHTTSLLWHTCCSLCASGDRRSSYLKSFLGV